MENIAEGKAVYISVNMIKGNASKNSRINTDNKKFCDIKILFLGKTLGNFKLNLRCISFIVALFPPRIFTDPTPTYQSSVFLQYPHLLVRQVTQRWPQSSF